MNKVLIIEDDLVVANIYRNKLTAEGYRVEVAGDGEAGIEKVRQFRPDAVLLDLMLPKVPGIELMKRIRSEPDFEKLPFIVLSSTYLTNVVQEAWKAGATKCLSKTSCTPREVLQVVRGSLSNASVALPGEPEPKSAPALEEFQPAAQTAPKTVEDSDEQFQAELRATLLKDFPSTRASLRASLQAMSKAGDNATRQKHALEMYRRIHALTGNAGVAGMAHIAQMADAFEALMKELYDKPENINASTLRTVASAVDFLALLSRRSLAPDEISSPARVLVVDDEAISRRAVTYALDKAKLKYMSVENPLEAYQLLSSSKFDLIFLDVDMPAMNGFELCSKIRGVPAYKKTPVVFITGLNDFERRANSTMSGGNDFIAKPFLFIELAVKALVYIWRGRLESLAR